MIDIHQHVLFGTDDGARNFDETRKMIRSAEKQGIRTVFATTHAGMKTNGFPTDAYRRSMAEARAWIGQNGIGLRLLSGSEILFSSETLPKLDAGFFPTLGGTEWVLLEFLPQVDYLSLYQGLKSVANAGYRPILAHAERYGCLAEHTAERMEELRGMRIRIQMNCNTVIRNDRLFKNRFIHTLLKKGYIDYVATDAHNMASRPVNMAEAYRALAKRYGVQTAEALCGKNQARDLQL